MKQPTWTKVFMIVLSVITVFAIIFGVLFRTTRLIGHKVATVSNTVEINGKIEELDIDVSIGDIKIVYGDKASVSYEYPEKLEPVVYWENEVLSVTEKANGRYDGNVFNDKYAVTITIPQNSDLQNVSLSADMGNIEFDDIAISGNFDVDADMGNVELTGISCEDFHADVDMGNIELKKINCKSIYVSADMGNIQVDGDFESIEGTCSMGNLEVVTPNENAVIDVSTDMGNCTVNGKKR